MALGSDIMMVLDECPPYPVSHEAARVSMNRTIRWADEAFTHYRGASPIRPPATRFSRSSRVPCFRDLRRDCAERMLDLDADGYAIGGLSVGEPRPLSLEMVEASEPLLPKDRPRYAMGVGMPDELPGICGARHRHDGLRSALPKRPQRLDFHLGRQGDHQARPV